MAITNKICTWGIIGCGNVTEVKSGPAFNLCNSSELLAVMRRNSLKAKDYAHRHNVPLWFDNAMELLHNDSINAVYVATPPSSHLKYTIKALKEQKDVYLEKPMVISKEEAYELKEAVSKSQNKLVVAHYRRLLPMFIKLKELIDSKVIGDVEFVDLKYLRRQKKDPGWRLISEISGGGYFHDIAPHQIDLMLYFFGNHKMVSGFSIPKGSGVSDTVTGSVVFECGVQFRGIWCFNLHEQEEKDYCEIYGKKGSIEFSFFGNEINIKTKNNSEKIHFEHPKHIQQPFIQETVNYFLGKRDNPCSVEEGVVVNEIIEEFTRKI